MKLTKIFALAVLAAASAAYAETISMVDLGEGNYTSVGDKVINITGSQGKTIENAVNIIPAGGIIILNGNFKLDSQINVKKAITIRSPRGSVLDAQGKSRVLRLQGQGIVIENLTITGGGGGGYVFEGGGINIDASSIDIINCRITGNNASFVGGGVSFAMQGGESKARFISCDISGNYVSLQGGGIYAEKGNIELINCTITGNSARFGSGGICIEGSASASAVNCNISGNTPDDVSGNLTVSGQASSAEAQEQEREQESSGGGCSASGLGLALAAVLIWRKHHD
ncbi:MAG: hypothetical protein IJR85_03995 [Synergistaceae bacterium]|nr:hypothetical protein [Synergistaceae bacterium]